MPKKPLFHPVPSVLGKVGKSIWESICTEYEFRPDEIVTLTDYCAFADDIAELTAEWEELGRPWTTKGSMGQLVDHPLPKRRDDLRMKRATLARQLKLPDLESGAVPANQNRDAANASWQPGVRGRGA